ncbi:MAG: electron transport complex subunit RsxE, partial [Elusimicrobia bacterium RIFOXYB2_FULL_49_7]
MSGFQNLIKGVFRENPLFVLVLGTCPALAVTTSAENGMGMGLASTFVLVFSNLFISLLKRVIPPQIRIPCYIVIIASFVSIVDMVMKAYLPSLYKSLGIFIPLIVVNCIILGRAEAYASKNTVASSLIDGLGMGMGFTLALLLLGVSRELLGDGAFFGHKL